MKKHGRLLLAATLFAVTLSLASCAGQGMEGMEGMDHGGMNGGSGGMKNMDHGGMASGMVVEDGEYSDEAFIDAMVPHHQGAVEMAEVAKENAEHAEIRNLAGRIIAAQRAEIEELRSIKQAEFGTSDVPMQMSEEEMQNMGMTTDPRSLADERPFDEAFIDAMIPHHQSAIEMARVASERSGDPEIQALAGDIIEAQKQEIEQMKTWRDEWYPES